MTRQNLDLFWCQPPFPSTKSLRAAARDSFCRRRGLIVGVVDMLQMACDARWYYGSTLVRKRRKFRVPYLQSELERLSRDSCHLAVTPCCVQAEFTPRRQGDRRRKQKTKCSFALPILFTAILGSMPFFFRSSLFYPGFQLVSRHECR